MSFINSDKNTKILAESFDAGLKFARLQLAMAIDNLLMASCNLVGDIPEPLFNAINHYQNPQRLRIPHRQFYQGNRNQYPVHPPALCPNLQIHVNR